ncbi:TetR/AcrR family transcriptional regulator [Fertoebacter nigrum]|uniref:TetR/AcrR family transcriptional regulator n=1 Tax=Fertoeibacter niger TaxID=2656921 RepID=A0A8X8KQ06_9RHOB|nr:TetR/AcrR family transcriptional regulator [Fertoeibacter niger]NUB45675.1 TetR/AcrR family transcriptional regulator [Fertoeibacter niger]
MPQTALETTADDRSDAILSSIRQIFIAKGFDGASMQDLARAAGMSVGNFYRYFPSKAAIIEALVARDLAETEQDFAAIINSPAPMVRLRQTIAERVSGKVCDEDGPLWAEICAAALRKPEIAQVLTRMETEIAGYLITIFAHATGLPGPEAARRFGAHAAVIVMMVKSAAMVAQVENVSQADVVALIRRNIDHMLNEISPDDVKG